MLFYHDLAVFNVRLKYLRVAKDRWIQWKSCERIVVDAQSIYQRFGILTRRRVDDVWHVTLRIESEGSEDAALLRVGRESEYLSEIRAIVEQDGAYLWTL